MRTTKVRFFFLSVVDFSFFLSDRRPFFLLPYQCLHFLSYRTGIFLTFLRGLLSLLLSAPASFFFLLSCDALSIFLSFFLS
ncbi:hypothetical protein Hanom_Chr00s162232g01825591 [Helianthus anomalus]